MGIVDNIKEDFYQQICTKHVLLLCALDVDSLCACKILAAMFRADDVEHTVVPVRGKEDVKTSFKDHPLVKCVVLINCGGCLSILEFMQPDNSLVQFFIIDSHRPFKLDNVYDQDQVTLVLREGDQLDVPEFEQVYSYEMEEDDEVEEECYSDEERPNSKRSRTDGTSSYEVRRKKHLWRRKREEILCNYYEFDYHETAASLVMYELACKLNRDINELVWLGIAGLTEQLLYEKIDRERYVTDLHRLEPNVIRHNRSDDDGPPSSINLMRISFDNELRLVLYRHWSLYESLRHSEYTVCKFKVWTVKGLRKLLEFLATMGLPLVQAKQKFLSMDLHYRDNLKELMEESARKFSLDDLTYGSFVAQFGYKTKLCAADVVYSSTALMEDVEKPYPEAFFTALDALSRNNVHTSCEGIEKAKQLQVAIMDQVRSFIDTHKVVCAGPFIYAYVEEGTANVKSFSKPLTLSKLARFLRECWIVIHKKARDMSFILIAPLNDDIDEGDCLVVGVPPHSEDSRRSEFSRAFQHAADRIQAHASFDHFSGSVVTIKKDERSKFLDALISLSAS